MRLEELFEDEEGSVVDDLRAAILDMLTPLAAQGVPKVSIQAIIDKMRDVHSGVAVDRALVMHVLDPQTVKMVKKIEGDSVFFSLADDEANAASEDEEQKAADRVKSTAVDQAKKQIKAKNGVAPTKAPATAAPPSATPAPAAPSMPPAGGAQAPAGL